MESIADQDASTESSLQSGGIFHRVDDLGADRQEDRLLVEELESNQLPYLLAVIPTQLTPSLTSLLRQLSFGTVFQHGYSHISAGSGRIRDEFPNEKKQETTYQQLQDGKGMLEDALGQRIGGYTPPWNRTSERAIGVLEQLGFTTFSAHVRMTYQTSMRQLPVAVDPVRCYSPLSLKPLSQVRMELEQSVMSRQLTGLVYHPRLWDRDYAAELYGLAAACKRFAVPAQLWETIVGLDVERCSATEG